MHNIIKKGTKAKGKIKIEQKLMMMHAYTRFYKPLFVKTISPRIVSVPTDPSHSTSNLMLTPYSKTRVGLSLLLSPE